MSILSTIIISFFTMVGTLSLLLVYCAYRATMNLSNPNPSDESEDEPMKLKEATKEAIATIRCLMAQCEETELEVLKAFVDALDVEFAGMQMRINELDEDED